MKIKPVQPVFRSFENDEPHAAEERRIKLLLDLLCEMDLPKSKREFLKLRPQRSDTLRWLKRNLAVQNSHHKNYSRAQNIIDLLLRSERRK